MPKPAFQTVSVLSSEQITPHMQRLVLSGQALSEFPPDCEGGYIKLLFNAVGGTDLTGLDENNRPVMRTYTIRRFLADQQAIEVDFVRHITLDNQCGFASRWAMNANVGDTISIRGPGIIANLNTAADWFFLTADMTSLPALSAKIKQLPDNAKGYAVIHVESLEDKQELQAPKGIEIHWITEGLADKARSLEWHEGHAAVWCACEFDSMRQLRQYFRNEKEVLKDNLYLSSYWKKGVSEDGHKVIKRQDAEENN
ncbi:siderophore-interacting protein [Vibrio sp. LaRot3]|uniref:siderophore-interacting protein n=1 Tax=Vibrio sp. LaRot3 TaxID=2998829 RepID=UPI0022CE0255|nr:siderophore-interacting protein [Vibrio sp. LaRot3]MDA0148893.1 siderophore-interacting protein [Vibrio sp. LaRot3]